MFQLVSDWLTNATIVCLVMCTVTYYFCTSTLGKWEKLKVPHIRPVPLFGNFLHVVMGKVHPIEFYRIVYKELSGHKYGGFYQMRTPYLMLRDPELINTVLKNDFSYFPDRGVYSDLSMNPLSDNLFFIENPRWKIMRNKLSPAFTPGKLKLMYDQIKLCSDELMKNVYRSLVKTDELEVKEMLAKYSTDVIGTCAFGLNLNSINDEQSAFRKYGKSIFEPSIWILLREMCLMISPSLLKVVRLKDFPSDAVEFFSSAFHETISYREKNNVVRNDFVQNLMQARNDLVLNKNLPENERFTESQIVANAFVIFAAGFETTSSAIAFCLYEIAIKKHIQDRVRDEIKLKLSENDNKIDNDFLVTLNYMDMVIAETLRMYPPVFALFRKAANTYHVPNDSLIIEKGDKLVIPINSLHYDPQYFKDPEVFDPERFSPEEKAKRPNGIYLPFGDGPRICIGKRFAEMNIRLALVEILTKFEVETCEKTEIPLKFSKKALVIQPENGIFLKFKKISN